MNKLRILSGIAILTLIIVVIIVNITTKTNTQPIIQTTSPTSVSNKCIIVIDGSSYDVTIFKKIHSGGNVFKCGTDMSQIFWSRHGQIMLDFMQRYKV